MKKMCAQIALVPVIAMVGLSLPVSAAADASLETLKTQVEQLQKQLEIVQARLKEQEQRSATKEDVQQLEKEVVQASEWLSPNTLVHLAGYGDVGYTKSYGDNDDGSFRVGTFAPIFHFQYRDLVMLEAELEIEVEDDGETNTALEYLTIDVFMNDYAALVAGKFLSPIGQFRQNLHPSWINKMASAPPGFGHDGAAPVSDVGFQVRGGLPEFGGIRTSYALYAANGPTLNFEDGELEGIDAEGFNEDADGDKVFGGRIAILPISNLEIGLSGATGKAAVNKDDGEPIDIKLEGQRDYDVYGADFSYQLTSANVAWLQGLGLRGEYVKSKVGSTDKGEAASGGATWTSWYTQAAYRIPTTKIEGVVRYTDFDSAINSADQKQWGFGLNYLFSNNFIAKFNYELNDGVDNDSEADNNRFLFQLAYGF
tara:strand:+ start:18250 stop:19527 length:1278 start_codon:yes stop_codon:yes gene_type:complete